MVESYLESNAKKKAKAKELEEERKIHLENKEKFEVFRKLCDSNEWKECKDFLKKEIYDGISLTPGEVGVGDWWLKYCWGLKCCIERIESHAKKYDDAVKELTK